MAKLDTLKTKKKNSPLKIGGKSFKSEAAANKAIASSDVPLIKVYDKTTKTWYLKQKYDDDELKYRRYGNRYQA
tara:strand:+ start:1471 stop:1692 length:222 start_codon:yes stop_codon:yes gene_type:complete